MRSRTSGNFTVSKQNWQWQDLGSVCYWKCSLRDKKFNGSITIPKLIPRTTLCYIHLWRVISSSPLSEALHTKPFHISQRDNLSCYSIVWLSTIQIYKYANIRQSRYTTGQISKYMYLLNTMLSIYFLSVERKPLVQPSIFSAHRRWLTSQLLYLLSRGQFLHAKLIIARSICPETHHTLAWPIPNPGLNIFETQPTYLIFVTCWGLKILHLQVSKFATKNCLVTKQRKSPQQSKITHCVQN